MKLKSTIALSCVLLAGFLSSCGEDPEAVKLHEKQNAELAHLRDGITAIEEQIKDAPADLSSELKAATEQHEVQKAEIQKLKTEIPEVAARIKSLQDEMKAYRAKYQIN